MASHLTITSTAPTGVTSSKSFSGTGASAGSAEGPLGLFGALLAGTGATTEASGTRSTGFSFDIGNLLKLGFEAGSGEAGSEDGTDPEALAGIVAAPAPLAQPVVLPQPLIDFVDALTDLRTALDAGGEVDPSLLGKVEETLAGLAEALGLDPAELTPPADIADLLAGMDADRPDLAATLAALFTPIAQALDPAATDTTAATDAVALATTRDRLAAIGDKMAALLAAIETGEVAPDKLASLGVAPGQTLDPDVEAALNRFAEAARQSAASVPTEPDLAAPSLKLSEPVLTGKPAETPAPAPAPASTTTASTTTATATTSATPTATETATGGGDSQPDMAGTGEDPRQGVERPVRDRPAEGFVAPVQADATQSTDPAQTATPTQTQAVRADAATAPRIIQAGYQTSQQQLNLPQLAFEMARQVTDGNTRFQIRLDPPELGRIDVRLEIDTSGQVNARMTVEKAETLDLMQRDQRGLERALQQAGIDTGKTNLEFSLKQNPFAGQQQNQQGQQHAEPGTGRAAGTEDIEEAPPTVTLYRGALQASGINIIA